MPGYLYLVVLLAILWLFLIRPRQRALQQQRHMLGSVDVGDEIVTAGGLYGTVTRLDDDEVRLEIAPGTEVRIARRAIAQILTEKNEGLETGANLPEA